MDENKYEVGDLLVMGSYPKHLGVVIKVEKDFYKTNHGPMNRITIHCETTIDKTFYLPELAVGQAFNGEPGWIKVDDP
jgi:hypothetical protein